MCLNYSEEENCDGCFLFCCLIVGQNTTNVFTLLGLVTEQWTIISPASIKQWRLAVSDVPAVQIVRTGSSL